MIKLKIILDVTIVLTTPELEALFHVLDNVGGDPAGLRGHISSINKKLCEHYQDISDRAWELRTKNKIFSSAHDCIYFQ